MKDYDRIACVIRFLAEHQTRQPDLAELSEHIGLSKYHFQRLFSRWAGVTPKDFLQCLTLDHARQALRDGRSVLDAAFDAGLSSPGRLHDLCVRLQAASPGEMKSGGEGWNIKIGFAETPFGTCLIGESPRGICHLSFVESKSRENEATVIQSDWPNARISWTLDADALASSIFVPGALDRRNRIAPLKMFVRGTEFQVRVWRALLLLPIGSLASYGTIAESIGEPNAARAVGSAVGRNQLAYLIPCHRVIRETGVVSDYRWGKTRKQAIVAWEAAHVPGVLQAADGK